MRIKGMSRRIPATIGSATLEVGSAPAGARLPRARGRTTRRQPGVMNKLEARYAEYLELQKLAGQVLWYAFDAIKLRLADKTFYTCDFFVLSAADGGILECHEVKGGPFEDDARVKIKVAASLYPFRFISVRERRKKDGGGWHVEEF